MQIKNCPSFAFARSPLAIIPHLGWNNIPCLHEKRRISDQQTRALLVKTSRLINSTIPSTGLGQSGNVPDYLVSFPCTYLLSTATYPWYYPHESRVPPSVRAITIGGEGHYRQPTYCHVDGFIRLPSRERWNASLCIPTSLLSPCYILLPTSILGYINTRARRALLLSHPAS